MNRLKSELSKEICSYQLDSGIWNTLNYLPNPDKIIAQSAKGLDAYRELKNDPHLWSCIQSRKSGILSLDYRIVESGADRRIIREVENMINSIDLYSIERDILETPLFGWQPIEIVWDYNKYGIAMPSKIQAKPQEKFVFDSGLNLRLKNDLGKTSKTLPEFKFICPRYEYSSNNPYGSALLSKCYWPITIKNIALRNWSKFSEKYGMPILIGQYARGCTGDEINKLAEVLAEMSEDAVIVTPSDINISLSEASRASSGELFKSLIDYCNSEVSKAILSQTLTTELNGGSYAAAQTHMQVRKEVILGDIRIVENSINQIIQYFVKINFGDLAPIFKIINCDGDNAQKAERDIALCNSGAFKFTKKYWMNSYGFNEDEFDI
jgi:phage gp29-like protein